MERGVWEELVEETQPGGGRKYFNDLTRVDGRGEGRYGNKKELEKLGKE